MKLPQLAVIKDCTGCMACVDSCPTESLTKEINSEGHFYYKLNSNTCIGCYKCVKSCPVESKILYKQDGYGSFYAAWAKDEIIRSRSASGGAFAAIAQYVLNKQGIVFGAANTKECEVKHIFIEKLSDLYQIQGSKYTSSDTSGSYKQAYNFLKQNKIVLFSGTGCQIAGLLTFLKNKKYSGKLITIDLICGGIPSKLLIQKFISNEPYEVKKIVSFRTKENGWKSHGFLYNMKVMDSNNIVHNYKGIRNLITDGFCSELTNRYSCYNCRFNGTKRLSDFTIGDLWGDKDFLIEHTKGVSLIIAHNNSSEKLLIDASDYIFTSLIDKKYAIYNNPRICKGKSYKQYMPERIWMRFLFNNFSYSTLKKIYAYDFSKYSLWMIYKLYRYILNLLLK